MKILHWNLVFFLTIFSKPAGLKLKKKICIYYQGVHMPNWRIYHLFFQWEFLWSSWSMNPIWWWWVQKYKSSLFSKSISKTTQDARFISSKPECSKWTNLYCCCLKMTPEWNIFYWEISGIRKFQTQAFDQFFQLDFADEKIDFSLSKSWYRLTYMFPNHQLFISFIHNDCRENSAWDVWYIKFKVWFPRQWVFFF